MHDCRLEGREPAPEAGALPGVSVVVPSYNHAPYLEACLRSILGQSHRPRELLVIDDGSADGSAAVAERVLREASFRTELVVRRNRGLAATLNEGLARTSSELFAYLGSDDRWHADRLGAAARTLGENGEAVAAYGPCYLIDVRDRVVGLSRPPRTVHRDGILPHLLRFDFVPASPTVTFRRSALQRFGWSETAWLEDYGLYLQLATAGPFAYVPVPLGFWRWHAGNRTWQCERMLEDVLAAQAEHSRRLGLPDATLRAIQRSARFRYAYHFALAGDRRRALAESFRNIRGARSPVDVADRILRLALPRTVLAWLRRLRVRGLAGGDGRRDRATGLASAGPSYLGPAAKRP